MTIICMYLILSQWALIPVRHLVHLIQRLLKEGFHEATEAAPCGGEGFLQWTHCGYAAETAIKKCQVNDRCGGLGQVSEGLAEAPRDG